MVISDISAEYSPVLLILSIIYPSGTEISKLFSAVVMIFSHLSVP